MVYWRYSFFYFTYFVFFAFQVAFLPVLAKALGFSPGGIAAVNTFTTLSSTISPLIAQIAAFRFMPSRKLFVLSTILSSFILTAQFRADNLIIFGAVWSISFFFSRAALSLVEVTAIAESSKGMMSFEHIRLWGSLGFIVGNFVTGICLDWRGEEVLMPLSIVLSVLTLVGIPFVTYRLRNTPMIRELNDDPKLTGESNNNKGWLLCFVLILIVDGLLYLSQSCYYVFLSIHLRDLGWSGEAISTTWSIGVVSEILVFLIFPKLQNKPSLSSLLRWSVLLNSLRMIILGTTTDPFIICCSQTLHIFSFATLFLAIIRITHYILPSHLRDRGQSAVAFATGLGGLTGRLFLSQLANNYDYQTLFFLSGVVSLIAYPIACWAVYCYPKLRGSLE